MEITNIYDKQLQAINEAEMKVHIAKRRLFEAERELDETLKLVETELNLKEVDLFKKDKQGYDIGFAVKVDGDWVLTDKYGKPVGITGGDSRVKTYKTEEDANESMAHNNLEKRIGDGSAKLVTVKDDEIVGDLSKKK